MRFGIDFLRLLDGFWGGFGGQVGAKLGPSWDKNQSTKISKKIEKMHLEGILNAS